MEQVKLQEFPSIYRDFVKMFLDNDACSAYLEKLHGQTGSSARRVGINICNRTWRNLRSDLIVARQAVEANFFAACWSKQSPRNRSPKRKFFTDTNGTLKNKAQNRRS